MVSDSILPLTFNASPRTSFCIAAKNSHKYVAAHMERHEVQGTRSSSVITRTVALLQACLLLSNVFKTLNYFAEITA